MKNNRSGVIAALMAFMVSGCSDRPDGGIVEVPVSGVLLAIVTTPNVDDRALLVEITGPGITGVERANSAYTVHSRASGGVVRAAAFGLLQGGALVKFSVPDVSKVAQYSARVLESSGPENMLREELTGYRIEFVRQ